MATRACFAVRGVQAAVMTGLALAAMPGHAEDEALTRARWAGLRAQAQAYEHGEGVARDPVRAVELFCQAAREGDRDAQYDLGWMYMNGRGVLKSDALAAGLFGLAAEQGLPQAQALLHHVGSDGAELPQCMRDLPLLEWDDSPPLSPPPDEPFLARTPEQQRVAELVQRIAPEYEVSPTLALAIIRAESNFNPLARSPKNAQGLMQLIPETSVRFKVAKPYDLVQNLRGGLAYLRWLLAYFEGNVPLVAAAYNAGEGAVERYGGVPPYAETRAYVKRVMQDVRRDRHPFDARVTEPSPELRRLSETRLP